MMKKWLIGLLAALYLAVCSAAGAQPKIPPAPTSSIYVQDYAGILNNETKTAINSLGARLAGATKAQIVVVTVKSLEGTGIEEYALSILRNWGVGDKTLNNGVVMLVAVNDRQSRIEVGYGLEGRLPDAKTGRIQDEYMIPYFQRGDYSTGVLQGYRVLAKEAAAEYNVSMDVGETRPAVHRAANPQNGGWDQLPFWAKGLIAMAVAGFFIFDWVFLGGNITMLILSLVLRRGGGGGGGGGGYGGGSGGGGGSSRRW